jgi:N-methylhydantoinase B
MTVSTQTASARRDGHADEPHVDPVTVEVLRNAFNAIAVDMNANLARSSFSPIIYEMKDCSVGVFNAEAELLGQAPGLPIFLGALDEAVKIVRDHFLPQGIREGDVYALNDPYLTGSHLNDVTVISPIHYEGLLVGFTATKAHWLDIGGKDAGVSVDTTEIYQEGIRFGPIRLFETGQPQTDILDIFARNSRLPHSILGDLNAQVAACRTGERRYRNILSRFGLSTVRKATEEIFDQAERADREAIAAMPDGQYTAEGYLDSDGYTEEPIPIRVKVAIDGSDFHIDLAGSSPQRAGCTNCGLAQTISAARLAYKFLINPHHAPNGGHFRALTVNVPERSIFSAEEPAACLYYAPHLGLMIELVLKALSRAVPERVPAGQPSDQMNFIMAGQTPNGRVYVTGEASAVGWGALPNADGLNAMVNYMAGDLKNLPAEVEEAKYPLLVTSRALETDSGGVGRFRGGLALIKEYVPTKPGCRLLLWLERTVTPAWGIAGGWAGRTARCVVDPGGPNEKVLKKANHLPIPAGTAVRCYTAGGGGYGPPRERDVERVVDDLVDGYISREVAQTVYGVRFCGSGSVQVDEAATAEARLRLAGEQEPTDSP